MTEEQIFNLYYDSPPSIIESLDLCRGDIDFRKVYITDDSIKKLEIKHTSNSFTDATRICEWSRLIDEYNKLGIYCPRIVINKNGNQYYKYSENGRDYFIFAEEFSKYDTAEHIGTEKLRDENGKPFYTDNVLRSVGKVAAAHFDFMTFHSAHCMLEPYSPPDTTDEGTECALLFRDYVRDNIPKYYPRVEKLNELFFKNQAALSEIYSTLPVSCFQADLNESNILLDNNNAFVGLIDFNLSGKEPVLNYTVRAALWQIYDKCLYDSNDDDRDLYWYSKALDDIRINSFLHNLKYIEEYYQYTDIERMAFPVLFRYMNSFWWQHVSEIKRIKDNYVKIDSLLCWLEYQMTRDDIRLP